MDDMQEIRQELRSINDVMTRNTAQLEIHIARTEAAEKRLDAIESFNKYWLGLMVSGVVTLAVRLLMKP